MKLSSSPGSRRDHARFPERSHSRFSSSAFRNRRSCLDGNKCDKASVLSSRKCIFLHECQGYCAWQDIHCGDPIECMFKMFPPMHIAIVMCRDSPMIEYFESESAGVCGWHQSRRCTPMLSQPRFVSFSAELLLICRQASIN